jgi:hypothetical protein
VHSPRLKLPRYSNLGWALRRNEMDRKTRLSGSSSSVYPYLLALDYAVCDMTHKSGESPQPTGAPTPLPNRS